MVVTAHLPGFSDCPFDTQLCLQERSQYSSTVQTFSAVFPGVGPGSKLQFCAIPVAGPELTWWWKENAGGGWGWRKQLSVLGSNGARRKQIFPFIFVSHIVTKVFKAEWDTSTRRVQFLGVYMHIYIYVYVCCIYVHICRFLMSCKYFCSHDLFSIWIFALPEVLCTSLSMPLDCGLLSVNRWLSPVNVSWGQGCTGSDEHWKNNWKARQLAVGTLRHWAIYNLSVCPSFGFVFLCTVVTKQSFYHPSSLHAKGNSTVKSQLHCFWQHLLTSWDVLWLWWREQCSGISKRRQYTILRCTDSSVHD